MLAIADLESRKVAEEKARYIMRSRRQAQWTAAWNCTPQKNTLVLECYQPYIHEEHVFYLLCNAPLGLFGGGGLGQT
jgi:hypothetical protein